jgi:hypothetical protein
MNILRLEFQSAQAGSYNHLIAQLIKKVRYFTTQIPSDEIKLHIPEARSIQAQIQYLDKEMGQVTRDYVAEIMDALNAEAEIGSNLREELAWTLQNITPGLIGETIVPDDIDFDYMEQRNTYWVEFNGFLKADLAQKDKQIIKDIVRAVCYKCGVGFVDCGE